MYWTQVNVSNVDFVSDKLLVKYMYVAMGEKINVNLILPYNHRWIIEPI